MARRYTCRMPAFSTTKMTAAQFFELGEDPPGVRLELVDGEIEVSPSPVPRHSYTEKMLTIILGKHILEHDLGELYGDVDTIFGEYDVRRPDLIYFRKDRLHLIGEKAMEGPPDLCVEIISPSSDATDRERKFEQYARGGVAYYWIVDPRPHPRKQTIEAWRLKGDRYESCGQGEGAAVVHLPPFPDLPIPLTKLWQPRRRG